MKYLWSGVNIVSVNPGTLNVAANIVCDQNIIGKSFVGNGEGLTGVVIPPTVTADLVGNVLAVGSVTADYFIGNGRFLSGITAATTANIPPVVTADLAGNVAAVTLDATGNVTAAFFIGNGALLTGVARTTARGLAEVDVEGNVTGEMVTLTGNITGENAAFTGNATASYFFGNGSALTGVTAAIPHVVTADLIGNVLSTGNVVAGFFAGNGAMLTGVPTPPTVRADLVGNVSATGNVAAGRFVGNGALLTSLPPPANITTDFKFFGNVFVPTSDVVANVLQSYSTIYCGNVLTMGFRVQRNLLTLYGSPNPTGRVQFSFGVDPGELRYQANSATSRHMFWCGTSQVASFGMQSVTPAFRLYPPNPAVDATAIIMNDGARTWFNSTAPGDPNGSGKAFSRPMNYYHDTGDVEFGADATVIGNLFTGTGTGYSTANAPMYASKASDTGRSINAAGTINASGADYAEYMTKAAGVSNFEKGAIVGVDSNGMLTDKFADAVTFAIKSTDPSIVGGDTWGTEAALDVAPPGKNADTAAVEMWKMALSVARARVDRVAFAGRVPCNVYGATPGQYIVPHDPGNGSIAGRAVTAASTTLESVRDRLDSVGRVVSVLPDGRALVVVRIP